MSRKTLFASVVIAVAIVAPALALGQPPGHHVLADSSGKQWSSPDPLWLLHWIGTENARLAAKSREAKPEKVARRASAPQAVTPSGRLPTGVVASRLPHIPTGQSWYGGNAGTEKPPPKVGATEEAGPDVYLTVIGGESDRQAVMSELERDPDLSSVVAAMGDRLSVHDYSPTDPMVADVGLPDGGKPDIVIQEAGGKVRYRARDNPGAAVLVAELRRADPRYKPSDDPTGEWVLKGFSRFFSNSEDQAPILVALGFLGFAMWWRRQ